MTGFGILFVAGYVVYRVFKFFSDRMIEKASNQCTGVVPENGEWKPSDEPIGEPVCMDRAFWCELPNISGYHSDND